MTLSLSLPPLQSHPARGPWHELVTLNDKQELVKVVFVNSYMLLTDLLTGQGISYLSGKLVLFVNMTSHTIFLEEH